MSLSFFRSLASLALAFALAHSVLARDLPARRQTSLTLEFEFQDITPTETSHVTVPAGEILTINGRYSSFFFDDIQWLKNGQPIPFEGGPQLHLGFIIPEDAGIYAARIVLRNGKTVLSQALALTVAPASATPPPERLANLSVLRTLSAGSGETVVAGFVVTGSTPKKMIVRAAGPSLAQFGVINPLKRPQLVIRDSAGRLYDAAFPYPLIGGAPDYATDLADSLAKAGAFRATPGSADAVKLLPMAPGAYTAEVTSADASGGTVLLEIYDVP